ncbi:dipeptide ABC transporter ATP-binding protein [Nocardioides currus]|uniref:Glutathione ABC transporter ATP-binding protein n=1 Tax=Nocardioides currus TaxID=2133958 RepID=A0A2R7YWG7_9ACTN|nr:ABC transporter ATP-binding protein [Nocardioides currus]PUA80663.1 glutathione ABC transporter ATP-binding protein [Nocardioides currus]
MSSPLLSIEHLAISFSHPRPAVNDISVSIGAGEIVALVGESGSGKSMTARAVLGLLPDGATATGSITLTGADGSETPLLGVGEVALNKVRGRRIAMVFQEPQTALNPVRTIGWQLREALRAHGRVDKAAARERAVELLTQVEIPSPEERLDHYPHQLSGGQRQRVVLALALANEPELLLADEPTTALDVTVQAEILALLSRIRERTGTSILLITHNMGVVAQVADRVVVLQQGDVVEEADTRTLFASPQHAYTKQLLGAVLRLPEPDTRVHALHEVDDRREVEPVVRFDGVHVAYGSRKRGRAFPAISDVTFDVRAGEVVGLVGESGSGKTTLGRLAAGLVPLAGGEVLVAGEDLLGASASRRRELRRSIAFVHQDPQAALDPRVRIGDTISEPLDIHDVGTRAERRARVTELLEAVRLPASYAARLPHELSGGQRQRVAVARALALRPTLVIADEPTSALDVSVQADVLTLFRQLQEELAFACLFISHDLAVVHEVADRVAVLKGGRLVELGPVQRVFAAPRADYTRALLAAVPAPDPSVRPVRADETPDEAADEDGLAS